MKPQPVDSETFTVVSDIMSSFELARISALSDLVAQHYIGGAFFAGA